MNPMQGPPGQGWGPPPGYGAPQGYGPPQGYGGPGYGVPPQQPYGAPGPSTSTIRALATPTIAALGVRAALPLLFRGLGVAGVRLGEPVVYEGIRGLVSMAAIILYFLWFSRVYAWVRAARGGTQYSTGMAIGGWFIPFANLYIPYAALSDAWKRTTGQGNPLILIFWLAYVGTIFFTVFYSVWQTNPNILVIERDTMWIAELIGWVDTLVAITAFGLWALIVKQLTDKVG